MSSQSFGFRTRARLINQLGDQLIKSEAIALLELIKNGYDADASECSVYMIDPESIENGKIVITDNGEGMNKKILETGWLEIGTSYKEELLLKKDTRRSKKFHRLRLGEKGIGRLGVHRLGRNIQIVTRTDEDSKEFVMEINWDDILNTKFIEDLPVVFSERPLKLFAKKSGTQITISRLRNPWSRKMARDSERTIVSLNSPFESDDSFRANLTIAGSNWLDGIMKFKDIREYGLFSFDITMEGNEITDFLYEFKPWETMKKLNYRRATLRDRDIKELSRMVRQAGKDYVDIDLNKYKIGPVRFKGIIFDRDARVLDLGVQDKKGLKEYLDTNGGVQVFRDNMRVMDYGEPGNDWLDLSSRRVNVPTKRISNNIILAAVYLNRGESKDLIEKANREGFVENPAYGELYHALRFAIDRVESLRKTDKDLLRRHYGAQKTFTPVVTSISELKDVVEDRVKDKGARNEITRYLDRIESEYESITDSLIKSAGAGLNLITVIHQMDKIIKDIKAMLLKKAATKIIEERVQTLSSLVEGYSILVKESEKKLRNLKGIVEQSVFNVSFRFEAHKIKLDAPFRNRMKNTDAICSEDHVLQAMMNIFDNSIWWLGYSKTKNPKIFIDISSEFKDHISVVIADNGTGFTKSTEEIIKPFVSDKPGGIGIGLHLTNLIMESLGGKLIFPDMDIFEIPKEYEKGAKIALAFKKGKS